MNFMSGSREILPYIAADGTTPLSGQSYISLPGGVPHALAYGAEPYVVYVHYVRPLDCTCILYLN